MTRWVDYVLADGFRNLSNRVQINFYFIFRNPADKATSIFFSKLLPIIISLLYGYIGRGSKLISGFFVPAQIEFPSDDFKCGWIHTGNLAGRRQTSRSVAAVLGSVLFRICGKQVPVFRIFKVPLGIVPLGGILALTFDGAPFSMIGYRIIAFYGDTERCLVDLVKCDSGGRPCNKHACRQKQFHHLSY
jgi:hypothetical protein